jgi:tRNA(Ile)-lysidine synthase
LAQHEDDQAETVLLQLKRGAGPKGLSGMPREFRKSSMLNYARPWISAGIGKQDILNYAKQHELSWFEDESNQDYAFERNFLRNEVLPILKNKWPQITKTISRSADLCALQNELVESFAKQALHKISTDTGTLSIDGLLALPNSLAAEVLRMWTLKRSNINPSHAQLKEIEKLCEAKVDQTGVIQLKQWQCRRFNHYLYWVDNSEVVTEAYSPVEIDVKALKNGSIQHKNISIHILSTGQEITKQTEGVSYIAVSENIETIKITYGDLQRKIKMHANRPTKTVKAWMKEWQIEPWRRMAVSTLLIADEVLAIVTDNSVYVRDSLTQPDGTAKPITLVIKNGKPLPEIIN